MIERQEIHCHSCDRFVHFDLDLSLNGNHVLHCPNCGHEHCRVVQEGRITDVRWAQRNGPTYRISTSSTAIYTVSTTTYTYSTSAYYIASSWLQTTSGT